MRTQWLGRVVAALGAMVATVLMASPAGAGVAISVPPAVNLGSAAPGTNGLSAKLGTVTVTATGTLSLLPSFQATVSSTSFTTGGRTPAETISSASILYWSGPVTASTGIQTAVPGQATALLARPLSTPQLAFSASGIVLSITTSWNPTIVVNVPAAAVAGTYTGTITHSVA